MYVTEHYSNPTATIFKSYEGKDPLAPYIDSFSGRGPNKITPNILKVTSRHNIYTINLTVTTS